MRPRAQGGSSRKALNYGLIPEPETILARETETAPRNPKKTEKQGDLAPPLLRPAAEWLSARPSATEDRPEGKAQASKRLEKSRPEVFGRARPPKALGRTGAVKNRLRMKSRSWGKGQDFEEPRTVQIKTSSI